MNQARPAPRETTHGSWIDGGWIDGDSSFAVRNPATGATITHLPAAGSEDVDRAVLAARSAFTAHRRATPGVRAGWCFSAAASIESHADLLARELTLEHGKPLADARAEVASAANGFRVAAAAVLSDTGITPQVADPGKRIITRREPLGVWAVITPWNFPLNIPVEYIGPAISTGNAVVWKPAPTTARIAALFKKVLLESDLPAELIQLVVTDEIEVARHLSAHPGIDAVGFTGGSAAGRAIEHAAWDKHLLLELGGNTPILVLDDADLDVAAKAIAASAFWNAGQVCSAAGKILATTRTARELANRIAGHADDLVAGDPLDPRTGLGPLHIPSSVDRIQRHVDDAVSRGAELITGGAVDTGAGVGPFYRPTVLLDISHESLVFTEETFGPVAAISVLEDESRLLAAANAGDYGLVGAVFTRSVDRAFEYAEGLDVGLVVVNDTSNYWELTIAFGGAHGRSSGRGRLGGAYALQEFTQIRTIALDVG
ncbi:aldehyde dehydrogenase [Nakamurella silvestris]|nr:aldehyde dehydrogenase [Nakamurella silvestris]